LKDLITLPKPTENLNILTLNFLATQ